MYIFCGGNARWRQTDASEYKYCDSICLLACTLIYYKHDYIIGITKGANCDFNWFKINVHC